MNKILSPLRPDDLVNSYATAPLAALEEVRAIDRLQLSAITPHDSGIFTFRLNFSDRFSRWWAAQTGVRKLYLLEAVERDRFGTHFLLSRQLNGVTAPKYGAVCPWEAIPQAAEILRTQHIGPAFWDVYSTQDNLLYRYVTDVVKELELAEQPLNSRELPAYCQLKWGLLLRLSPADVDRTLDYLAIEKPADFSAPLKVDLGANCFAIVAWNLSRKEPLRVGLTSAWNDDMAVKDLTRWLRGFESAAKAEGNNVVTTTSP